MPPDARPVVISGIETPACFSNRGGILHVSGKDIRAIAGEAGTPFYLYAEEAMASACRGLADALAPLATIYYSVKANPNPAVVSRMHQLGAGLEIASLGEYRIAREAGCPPELIVFAGPGKRRHEIESVLAEGIGEIHLESLAEAEMVSACAAALPRPVHVSLRINPSQAAQGGAMRMGGKASAFGMDEELLPEMAPLIDRLPGLHLRGLHLYSGTQILSASTLETQWRHAFMLAGSLGRILGRPLVSLDLGGGLGIPYHAGDGALCLADLRDIAERLQAERMADPFLAGLDVIVEPGRFLVGPSGIYVIGVTSIKESRGQTFVITDGGMHHHLAASGNLGQVIKRDYPMVAAGRMNEAADVPCQIVGPLCTPLDTLARKALMPRLAPGDLIAIFQSGAYGLTASPINFLSHPPPPEIILPCPGATNAGTE